MTTDEQRADAIVTGARDRLVRSAEAGRIPPWVWAPGFLAFICVPVAFVLAGYYLTHGSAVAGWATLFVGVIANFYAAGLTGYLVGRIHAATNVAGYAISWLVHTEPQPQQFLAALLRDDAKQ